MYVCYGKARREERAGARWAGEGEGEGGREDGTVGGGGWGGGCMGRRGSTRAVW